MQSCTRTLLRLGTFERYSTLARLRHRRIIRQTMSSHAFDRSYVHGDVFFLDEFADRQWDDPNFSGTRFSCDRKAFVDRYVPRRPTAPLPRAAPVAPSHHRTVAPSHCRTIAPSHHRTVAPSHRRTISPSHHLTVARPLVPQGPPGGREARSFWAGGRLRTVLQTRVRPQ
jgi:hypothetical protein